MTSPLNLILSESPVQRGLLSPVKSTKPNVAVVYSTGAGRVVYFGGRPLTRGEQLFSQYRLRYDVDMSDHRRRVELRSTPLPSRGDHYFFIATVDVAFRVHDPEEIVRRDIRDALPIVYGYLTDRLRAIARGFDIEQSEQAEQAARQAFAGEAKLPEGIVILGVSPRLLPDADATAYLKRKKEAERALQTDRAQHQVDVQKAVQQGELAQMEQVFRLKAAQTERAALGAAPLTAHEMAQRHLANNPQDTAYVLQLLMDHERAMIERQDLNNQRTTDFVKFMMQSGVVPPGDFEQFVAASAGQMSLPGGPPPALTAAPGPSSWSQAPVLQPSVPQQQPRSAAVGKPEPVVLRQDPTTKVWSPADGVQPMYVMVDESSAARPYIGDLSDGVRGLLGTLAGSPDVSPAIRLSVLGFADGVAVRLPLDEVTAGSQSPWLTTRGPADYADAFETLLDAITPDIEALKQQGLKVLRPVVFLLSASTPADDTTWRSQHRRLVDPGTHRYAPGIVAYGVGEASPRMIAEMATRPEFGYVMDTGIDAHAAIEQYWQALVRDILTSGRSLINGTPALAVEPPVGFRLAGELV
jgi:uncharacterized protein YegL